MTSAFRNYSRISSISEMFWPPDGSFCMRDLTMKRLLSDCSHRDGRPFVQAPSSRHDVRRPSARTYIMHRGSNIYCASGRTDRTRGTFTSIPRTGPSQLWRIADGITSLTRDAGCIFRPAAYPGDILSRVSPPGTPPVSFVAFYPSYCGSPAMIGWRIKFIVTGVYLKAYFSLFMIGAALWIYGSPSIRFLTSYFVVDKMRFFKRICSNLWLMC